MKKKPLLFLFLIISSIQAIAQNFTDDLSKLLSTPVSEMKGTFKSESKGGNKIYTCTKTLTNYALEIYVRPDGGINLVSNSIVSHPELDIMLLEMNGIPGYKKRDSDTDAQLKSKLSETIKKLTVFTNIDKKTELFIFKKSDGTYSILISNIVNKN